MVKLSRIAACGILVAAAAGGGCAEPSDEAPAAAPPVAASPDAIRVLIIDGVNNHDWESTTAITRATLEQTGHFAVDVSTSPGKRASREEWDAWRPAFADYQVVLSNFNDDCEEDGGCESLWSKATKSDLENYVRDGGGFVAVHAADNHDANWLEYNRMIGVGGWGGRQAGVHGSILRDIDGAWTATSPDDGISGEHGEQREFLVIHDQPDHPILAGLPAEWMHATDELYSSMRGPAENVEVLARAHSLYTNEDEPILMVVSYGSGKIFHIPMGHYNDESEPFGVSLECVGFQTVLARGTEYVATGAVTLGVPSGFPGAEASVVLAPAQVVW
jgi:type 1 glutamine amidotransferase